MLDNKNHQVFPDVQKYDAACLRTNVANLCESHGSVVTSHCSILVNIVKRLVQHQCPVLIV